MILFVAEATRATGLLDLPNGSANPRAPQTAGEWDWSDSPSGGTQADCVAGLQKWSPSQK